MSAHSLPCGTWIIVSVNDLVAMIFVAVFEQVSGKHTGCVNTRYTWRALWKRAYVWVFSDCRPAVFTPLSTPLIMPPVREDLNILTSLCIEPVCATARRSRERRLISPCFTRITSQPCS